jgi:nucleobase transporter 1/2
VTTVLVAFQHYLVMLGTTVLIATILVPLMGGGHVSLPPHSSVPPFRLLGDRRALTSATRWTQAEKAIVIQTILFLAGINTLLQVHFGTRLPAVMAGSYTYIYATTAIALSPRYLIIIDPLEVRAAPHINPLSSFLQRD